MLNPLILIGEILEAIPNDRTKEIIRRRFGLGDGQRHPLEAIGRDHNIPRERVRQIEENGLKTLKKEQVTARLEPIFGSIKEHLAEHGDLKKESRLYDDLSYVCYPVKEIERMKAKNDFSELERCRAAFYLILTLGDQFSKLPESDHFHSVWTINKDSINAAKKMVDSLVGHLDSKKETLNEEQVFALAKSIFPELSDKAIRAYIDASKFIRQNHLGKFGLANWSEISPKGVKDKAYIVLKDAGKPLHFGEVTDLINQILPSGRRAYIQTVHNELIKDPRFVLVGRGLYALSEWGYQPGTVAEIIKQVLEENGFLTKEEIVKKVLEKRIVKANTVLINLQNKKVFERDSQGKYSLKK